jgi:senataxin
VSLTHFRNTGSGKTHTIIEVIVQLLKYNHKQGPNPKQVKLLLCAPSNAAIDEATLRLIQKTKSFPKQPQILRIGDVESSHQSIQNVSVDSLLKQWEEKDADRLKEQDDLRICLEQLTETQSHLIQIKEKLADAHGSVRDHEKENTQDIRARIRSLNQEKNEVLQL